MLSGKTSRLAGLRRIGKLYLKSRIGMLGLIIILFFVLLAVLAPWIAPHDPIIQTVSSPFDIPAWATAIPAYRNTPVDQSPATWAVNSPSDIHSWNLTGQNYTASFSTVVPPQTSDTGSIFVNASLNENTAPYPENNYLPNSQAFFALTRPFEFSGPAPTGFETTVVLEPVSMTNVSTIYVNEIIQDPSGNNFSLASVNLPILSQQITISPSDNGTWKTVSIAGGLLPLSGLPAFEGSTTPASTIFHEDGTYKYILEIEGVAQGDALYPALSMRIVYEGLHLDGGAYGLLGTDNFGRDVWSQFVWGSQVSLLIGILSGIGAVGLGAAVGIASGYLGGKWDQVIGRVTDFVLVLPFLPLLIIIVSLLVVNRELYNTIYVWVILIFVALSWPFIGKIIRSQVLLVKERQYVEASRALGSGTGHILVQHILPNVMGLVYSQVALNVGGFILLEAALDFLAISVHTVKTITWGLMLTYSLPYAVNQANLSYVWWWFFPPGVAIALLSLAFVLVGYALDSIFNPKLRAR